MQAPLVVIGSAIALIVVVPVVYVIGTLARNAVAAFRSRDPSINLQSTPEQRESYVDSLAWTLRWGEVMNTEAGESRESMGGPPPSGGP